MRDGGRRGKTHASDDGLEATQVEGLRVMRQVPEATSPVSQRPTASTPVLAAASFWPSWLNATHQTGADWPKAELFLGGGRVPDLDFAGLVEASARGGKPLPVGGKRQGIDAFGVTGPGANHEAGGRRPI